MQSAQPRHGVEEQLRFHRWQQLQVCKASEESAVKTSNFRNFRLHEVQKLFSLCVYNAYQDWWLLLAVYSWHLASNRVGRHVKSLVL